MAKKSIKQFDEKNGVRVCALVREALDLCAAAFGDKIEWLPEDEAKLA